MKLQELLSEDLYKSVQAAIDKANEGKEEKDRVKFVDLSEGGYVGKGKYDSLQADYNTLKETTTKQNATIEDLKKGNKDNEALQKKISDLTADLAKTKAEGEKVKKNFAIQAALTEAGCTDSDYITYKMGGVDAFEFADDGKLKDLESKVKDAKENFKSFFKAENGTGYKPENGGGTPSTNPFAKDTFSLTEQSKLMQSNPEQARALAAEAGVKL